MIMGVEIKVRLSEMKRIVALLLCIALALIFVTSCSEAERPLTVAELLEVAERYLLEGNYEQALVEFMRVIEVEPREPRGYTGAADALIGLGRYDEARAILEQGLGVLPGNAELQGRLEDLRPTEVVTEPEPDSLEPETEPGPEIDLDFLSALPDLLETDGFEALEEALDSGELKDLISQIETFPMIHLDECGTRGIGVYMYDGEYWIYIGEFSGQIRSGHGVWFPLQNEWGYRFEGEWRDDLPNGIGTVYYFGDRSAMRTGLLWDPGFWCGNNKKIGSMVNGLWHGTVEWGEEWRFILEYENGKVVVIWQCAFRNDLGYHYNVISEAYLDGGLAVSTEWINIRHGVLPYAEY